MLVNICLVLGLGVTVYAGTNKDFKGQHCTDPRTMQKHAAYTEWADAYSCTRHRCQPGGRNLAIYTVGCKRVEAPESAIECEEVVEDTNMQFPFCCTRLRCLVVVRGEVWTRVLGQPWETLPAAPWSHMYKMKRPPPTEFASKSLTAGPVYELGEDNSSPASANVLRSKSDKDCDETAIQRATGGGDGAPDIVIALETNNDRLLAEKHKRMRTKESEHRYFEEVRAEPQQPHEREKQKDLPREREEKIRFDRAEDIEETATEILRAHEDDQRQQTEAPDAQWNAEISAEVDNAIKENQSAEQEDQKDLKPSKLQDLVDAIGTRMKDIENVVQKMSERVQKEDVDDEEKRLPEAEDAKDAEKKKFKKPNPNGDKYKRFQAKTKSKHTRKSENPDHRAFPDDEQNGYYSDAVNSILRRSEPKEPQHATYMAPIESRRKHHKTTSSERKDKKKKSQKKKKGKHHKKHHDHDKRRRNSVEADRFVVSLEDNLSSGSNVIV